MFAGIAGGSAGGLGVRGRDQREALPLTEAIAAVAEVNRAIGGE